MGNLLIYQSSAGSGKTYKLAKEYIKLAFKFPGAFKNILAITFTNKATEEMKSRIISFLVDLSNDSEPQLKEQLLEEGIKESIKDKAKVTLDAILHNYSDFSVSTIDSFFNRVLRSFARELKLQVGYEIELDKNEVLKEITEMLFKDLKKDEELKKYFEDFIFRKISEDKGWDVERDIIKLADEIFKERYWEKKFLSSDSGSRGISDSRDKIESLFNDIMNIINDFENHLRKIGDEAEKVMNQYGLEVGDFSNKDRGVGGFFVYKIRDKKDFDINSYVLKAYNSTDAWFAKGSKKIEIIKKALDDGLYELLKNAVEFIQSESVKYYTAKELKNILYTLGIFEDLISKLNEYRIINRKLLQSDVNNILRSLISTDNSPFIYEKIGSNFKNLLIDEFQDTSTFQWKNLLPLLINVLSENGTALVVGDVKQSIYRFRSGNMKLLLSQIYIDLEGFDELIKTEYLKTNRRSCKEIVEFNNLFFEKAIAKISGSIENAEYKNLLLKAYNVDSTMQEYDKEGGYIEVNYFPEEKENKSAKEKAEEKTLEIIKDVISDDYSLSDVLILVRKNEEARQISTLLTKSNYDIISSESLLVNNSPKVRIIVDLLKYISDNKNAIAKADVLYNYIEFILKEKTEYSRILENIDKSLVKILPAELFKTGESPKIKPVLNDLTVYEVCENLIQIFGFGKTPDPYLIKFLNCILEFTKENSTDLISFLEWWEEKKNGFSIDSPADTNAIRIMTIHKSKGLQGKIVIVPYANWKLDIDGSKDLIWVSADIAPFDKSAAYPVRAIQNLSNTYFKNDYEYESSQTKLDNLNLLYVVFTRAEERLYVLAPEKKKGESADGLIKNVLSEFDGFTENVFIKGKKEKAKNDKMKKDTVTEKLEHSFSGDWYRKTIIKPKHTKFREFIDKDFAFRTNWGIIIHKALSYINTVEDIDGAVNKIYSEGIFTDNQKSKIREQLEKIFENKYIRQWFSCEWNVKTETEILLSDGKILRPDRVLIKDKEAIIIDYKTGIEREEYKKQVEQYAETLYEMGFSKVSKFLFYLNYENSDNIKIVEVN